MLSPTNVCDVEKAPPWDPTVRYAKDSIVRGSDGHLYLATCDNPTSDPTAP